MSFVGLENFSFAWQDEWFWKSLKNTGWLAVASGVPQHLSIPLAAITRFVDPSVNFGLTFETRGRDTGIIGSSMGGLISLYAAARHPLVFGGVGAVSTHWPACDGCMIDWLRTDMPDALIRRHLVTQDATIE